jgi:uncharacterized DUF497 family protein
MKFEWDENKRRTNLEKHGLDFEDAYRVFTEEAYVVEDIRENYDEPRYILTGLLYSRVVVVAFAVRNDVIRIISMRKATKREQKHYVKKRFKKNR